MIGNSISKQITHNLIINYLLNYVKIAPLT